MSFPIYWGGQRQGKTETKLKTTSEIRSNSRLSLLCIQKRDYVITLSHCAFFMTDLKLNSSSLSIVGTYWRSLIIACRLVYPKEFISTGLLSVLQLDLLYIKADVLLC